MVGGALGSLAEGTALLLLIPMINIAANAKPSSVSARLVERALGLLGLQPTIAVVILVFAALGMLAAILQHFSIAQTHRLVSEVETRMRVALFSGITEMEWVAYARQSSGALIQSVYGDAEQGGQGVLHLCLAGTAALSAIVYFAIATILTWQFTFGVVLAGLALAPVYVHFSRRGAELGRETNALSQRLLAETTELLGNAKSVFSQGQRRPTAAYFGEYADDYRLAHYHQAVQAERLKLAAEIVAVALIALFLYVFVGLWHRSVGVALVWVGAFYRLVPRVIAAQMFSVRAISNGAWIENWATCLELVNASAREVQSDFGREGKAILELRDVTYAFPGNPPVLNGLDFTVERGEILALVGPSGHGKTTVLDIITGLLTPDAGDVLIDGSRLGAAAANTWQLHLGVVLQDSPMLHRSIADNVAFGATHEREEADVWSALECAAVADFVRELPEGLETIVGERGARLSGGQRQRLALARALYRKPNILLLDEATSALDPAAEERIAEMLERLKGDFITVLVAHDGPLLRIADRTIWIEEGVARELSSMKDHQPDDR